MIGVVGAIVKGIVKALGPVVAELFLVVAVSVATRYGRRIWRWFWD